MVRYVLSAGKTRSLFICSALASIRWHAMYVVDTSRHLWKCQADQRFVSISIIWVVLTSTITYEWPDTRCRLHMYFENGTSFFFVQCWTWHSSTATYFGR
ncbi:TPA: hypothetical protein N0F65_002837 [Lagenidium giganteum]|uniref:Secreted protein n=1 Tax=Lagenidium giganteum TaxID=4803 RepID=A0AAV2ZBM2_9STRA|nr:TPA: hypothetical protein N0F65_002837 [Lagenidium giganteum]